MNWDLHFQFPAAKQRHIYIQEKKKVGILIKKNILTGSHQSSELDCPSHH